MKKSTALVVMLAAVLGAASLRATDIVIDEIIARINGSIISHSEFLRSKEQIRKELREQFPNDAEAKYAEREKEILRDLIDQQLLIQKAKDLGLSADTEVVKRLDEMRKQMKLETMEELEKAATEQGISFEDFKQNMKNSIVTQQVISREVGSHIQITQPEVQAYYESHRAEMEQPEKVRLAEILVAVAKPAAAGAAKPEAAAEAAQDAAAEAKAGALLERIKKGEAFEAVAKAASDGPTAQQGGDLGYFKRGTLAKELEDIAFGAKTGELSEVIRTRQGFIILKVVEHNQAGVPPLKEVENQIQEQLYLQKLQPSLRAYLTKLREEAFIEIKPGYVDSGASPNQTKPIITAAAGAEPETGKTKKKKRFLVF